MEPPIYSRQVNSKGENLDFPLTSEVRVEGSLVGLSP